MAIINNVAYSWSMITLSSTALGIDEGSTTLEGVSAIKWSKKRKVESNYGMGGKPVSLGFWETLPIRRVSQWTMPRNNCCVQSMAPCSKSVSST